MIKKKNENKIDQLFAFHTNIVAMNEQMYDSVVVPGKWAQTLRNLSASLLCECKADQVGDTVNDPEAAAILASVRLQLQAAHEEVRELECDLDLPYMTRDTLENMSAEGRDERSREKATRAISIRSFVREWQGQVLHFDNDAFDTDSWVKDKEIELGATPADSPHIQDIRDMQDTQDIRIKAARMRKEAEQPLKNAFRRFRSAYSDAVLCVLRSSFRAAEDSLMASVEMGQPDRRVARRTVQRWARQNLSRITHRQKESRLTTSMFKAATYLLSTDNDDVDARNTEACRRFVVYLIETVTLIPNRSYIGRARQEREYAECFDLTTQFVSFMRAPGFSSSVLVSVDDADKMKNLWASYIQRCEGSSPPFVTTIIASLIYRCAFGKTRSDVEDPLENMILHEKSDVGDVTQQMRVPFPSKIPNYMLTAIEHARDRVVDLRKGLALEKVAPHTDVLLSSEDMARTYDSEMTRYIDVWADVVLTIETKGKKRRAT